MTTVLLFVTTAVSPETKNELLKETSRAEYAYNWFSLVRSKDQTYYEQQTPPVVKTSPTDFIGETFENLSAFTLNLPEHLRPDNYGYSTFAYLDARRVEEKSVVIWHQNNSMPPDQFEGEWDDVKVIKSWYEFRTP